MLDSIYNSHGRQLSHCDTNTIGSLKWSRNCCFKLARLRVERYSDIPAKLVAGRNIWASLALPAIFILYSSIVIVIHANHCGFRVRLLPCDLRRGLRGRLTGRYSFSFWLRVRSTWHRWPDPRINHRAEMSPDLRHMALAQLRATLV